MKGFPITEQGIKIFIQIRRLEDPSCVYNQIRGLFIS